VTFTGVDNRGALQFTPKELAAHDREVRVKELRDAAMAEDAPERGNFEWTRWLRARAEAIRRGEL